MYVRKNKKEQEFSYTNSIRGLKPNLEMAAFESLHSELHFSEFISYSFFPLIPWKEKKDVSGSARGLDISLRTLESQS